MKKRITQKDMVIQYIKDFGEITPLDAFRDLGVMRLSAIIYKLRWKDLLSIKTEYRTEKNRYGTSVTFAVYSFE